MQSQINPHFLYNTLDAIHWKAFEHDDEEMIQIIDSLSNFYRLSLSNGAEFITIADETVLHKNSRFVGTGHNAILQLDDEGNTWMLYHAFELSNLGAQRQVLLDQILWDEDGWPYVNKQEPSESAYSPIIK